jgi:hypothetical protein
MKVMQATRIQAYTAVGAPPLLKAIPRLPVQKDVVNHHAHHGSMVHLQGLAGEGGSHLSRQAVLI